MNDAISLLIHSLDHDLSPKEQAQLDRALQDSPELREEQARLLKMRRLFENASIPENPAFANAVLERLNEAPSGVGYAKEASIIRLFPRVAAACILLIGLAYAAIYFSESASFSDDLVGIENVSPEEASYVLLDY